MAQESTEKDKSPRQGRQVATVANLFGNGANVIIVAVQAIVLTPLYLQTFGDKVYGAWLGSGEILNVLQLFDLGLTNVLTQRIGAAHAKKNLDDVGAWFAAALVLMSALAFILSATAYVVSFQMGHWMKLSGPDADLLSGCFRLGAVTTFLFVFNFAALGLGRGTQDTALINSGMVIGGLAGFAVTYIAIRSGCGLWSIPYGMITRNAISAIAGLYLCLKIAKAGLMEKIRIKREFLYDLYSVTPATAASGIAYVVTTQTEAALVATLLRPELATVLILTRRAVDVAGSLLNTLAYSCYGSFAHFVASDQRHRSLKLYREILSLWTSLAISMGAAYLAVNPSLVPVWSHFKVEANLWLTVVMAAQMVVVGRTQLVYYLYRASGAIVKGSWLQFGENILRFGLGIILLKTFGLVGFGIAGVLVTGVVSYYCQKVCEKDLSEFAEPVEFGLIPANVARALLIGGSALLAAFVFVPRWSYVVPVGVGITIFGSILLIQIDPTQDLARRKLNAILEMLRLARSKVPNNPTIES